ncbi:MAG: hypothetical protein ACOYL3_06450 [Desulfuromonadaceae bacterium]
MSNSPDKKDKKKPSWSDIKKALAEYDRPALLGLIADLYSLNPQNKTFLHARFASGIDALKPYLKIIDDALYPDIYKNKPVQIAKAKKAIADYTKASGEPKGMLELMLFFVETGSKFTVNCGDMYEEFYLALERMYEKALDLLLTMDEETIDEYFNRFEDLVTLTKDVGWGYHDSLAEMFYNAFPDE